jgi:tetratricopeptide (TPR) repeat protein
MLLEEAISVARETGDKVALADALGDFALLEASERNYHLALDLNTEALALAGELGDPGRVLTARYNVAWFLRLMGRAQEALEQMRNLIPHIIERNDPDFLTILAQDYAAILADLGDHHRAVRLLGAADAMHQRLGIPGDPTQQGLLADPIAKTHGAMTSEDWDAAYQAGRNTTVEDILTEAAS